MQFLSSHHGYLLGSEHPFVAVPTLGEWFSTFVTVSCHPTANKSSLSVFLWSFFQVACNYSGGYLEQPVDAHTETSDITGNNEIHKR